MEVARDLSAPGMLNQVVPIKLSNSNYAVWQRLVRNFIASQRRLHHIEGTTPPPSRRIARVQVQQDGSSLEELQVNPEYEKWQADDMQVITWIHATLSEEILPQVLDMASAYELWQALKDSYMMHTNAKSMQLKRNLMTLKQGDKLISVYYNEVKNLYDQLALIGDNVSAKDRVIYFIQGLRDEYLPLVDSMSFMQSLPSFEAILPSFLQHEQNLIQRGAKFLEFSKGEQVLVAGYDASRSRGNGRFRGGGRGRSGRGRYSGSPCQICSKDNHSARYCYDRYKPDSANSTSSKLFPHQTAGVACMTTDTKAEHSQEIQALEAQVGRTVINDGKAKDELWVLDSGAGNHICANQGKFIDPAPYQGSAYVTTGDGKRHPITHTGSVQIHTSKGKIVLKHVFLVPTFKYNLISVSQLSRDLLAELTFTTSRVFLKDLLSKTIFAEGEQRGGLYFLEGVDGVHPIRRFLPLPSAGLQDSHAPPVLPHSAIALVTPRVWHDRLGHCAMKVIDKLCTHGLIQSLNKNDFSHHCSSCELSKHSKSPFSVSISSSSRPLELIHTDLWGPAPNASLSHRRYYAIFVDDYSRYSWIYFLSHKSDFHKIFVSFHKMVENLIGHRVTTLRSDGGGEFMSKILQDYMQEHGIIHQRSCPYTPEQNGVAERKHRHVRETGMAMMIHAKVPLYLWTEAFHTAVYLINRLPTQTLDGDSPHLRLFGNQPSYGHMRTFGCIAFVHNFDTHKTKFSPRAVVCIFIGYDDNCKGYRCFDPSSRRVYVSRHVTFHEENLGFKSHETQHVRDPKPDDYAVWIRQDRTSIDSTHEIQDERITRAEGSGRDLYDEEVHDVQETVEVHKSTERFAPEQPATHSDNASRPNPTPITYFRHFPARNKQVTQTGTAIEQEREGATSVEVQPEIHPRRSTRTRYPVERFASYGHFTSDHKAFFGKAQQENEPLSYLVAIKDGRWVDAMNEEIQAMHTNHSWDIVPRPHNKNVVSCKWVYKIKYRSDGSVERFKARLVARGFTQQHGIDYEETFSPVVKITTVRIVLHIALNYDWPLYQLDVKNAFLHGELKEEVFMEQPQGYAIGNPKENVCKLNKSIYGLKQASRTWFEKFYKVVKQCGFSQADGDSSVFICKDSTGIIIILLYVDDIIVTGSNKSRIRDIKILLQAEFQMKDLGKLQYFLGIEVDRDVHSITLSQRKYAIDLLSKANMLDCKPVSTPLATSKEVYQDDEPFSQPMEYRMLAGGLQYLTLTRPDITFAVNLICQFMHEPRRCHMEALKRILRYVKGTLHHGIQLHRMQTEMGVSTIMAYSDADWAGNPNTRRSTTGFCVFFGPSLIAWRSKKQRTVARSSAEAEYRSLASVTAEVIWIRKIVTAILGAQATGASSIYCDNKSTLAMAMNPVFHDRTKHVEIDHHFIREKLQSSQIELRFVGSAEQLADCFTKALDKRRHKELWFKLITGSPVPSLRGAVEDIEDNHQINPQIQSTPDPSQALTDFYLNRELMD